MPYNVPSESRSSGSMKTLLVVVGARPNFVKVARFQEVAAKRGDFRIEFVHTGQHSDDRMTSIFIEQFGLRIQHRLEIEPGDANQQIARIMLGLGPLVERVRPAAMVVVGDVTGTLAAALTANKMNVPLVHVESGLRSGDRTMPEEMNRILTDRLADHFFCTEPSGRDHLMREGAEQGRIHLVGNTMIDTLAAYADPIAADTVLHDNGWGAGGHALVTMHRPAAVDPVNDLERTVDLIEAIALRFRTILPLHPRTSANLERSGQMERLRSIADLHVAQPLAYFAFQRVLATSACVITDSGGVQEESTYLGIPCLTLRPNTERPITVDVGTNELIPFEVPALNEALGRITNGSFKKGSRPERWDGQATERIFEVLASVL